MFESAHAPGSNAWYDDLEAWMRLRGERVTDETINVHRFRVGQELGIWIEDDYRFLDVINNQKAAKNRS